MKAKIICVALLSLFLVPAASAQDLLPRDDGIQAYHGAPRYRDSESHPLRIVGYIFHPVGWVLRETIFRPWSAFAGSDETTKSVFGFKEPFAYRRAECFRGGDTTPDCWSVPPYSKIGGRAGALVDGDNLENADSQNVPSGEQQVYFPDVNFEFDKAVLTDLGKGRVRQISQLLASVPNLNIVVEGHTDYLGTDQYNDKLGLRRAEAVMQELVGLGIDPARISSVSHGETRPVFAEEEDWARAVNRRAQFSIRGEGEEIAAAPAVAAEDDTAAKEAAAREAKDAAAKAKADAAAQAAAEKAEAEALAEIKAAEAAEQAAKAAAEQAAAKASADAAAAEAVAAELEAAKEEPAEGASLENDMVEDADLKVEG